MFAIGQQIGPFLVERQLGRGGMGAVFRARHQNGQVVALKVMSARLAMDESQLVRFEREAAILKQLRHPHIVRLLGTGRFREVPFIVMEYVNGESLDHLLHRRGKFGWEDVVNLGQQLCGALQHAHDQGIIHRDLKPANLLMLPDGGVKLTDFGIAKDMDQATLTAEGCAVGTAAYMSPEQCRGEKNISHKADLYALGVVFYELLTGKLPFEGGNTLEFLLKHTEARFERPSRLSLETPVWLDTLVCHLLEKEPEKRPFDAAVVAQALADVAEKVTAQRSAGLDPVQVRRSDRVKESDREVARALKAAARGDLRRPTGPRMHERRWFQAAGLAGILIVIAGILYFTFRPPGADRLFHEAEKLMTSANPEHWDQARKGPLKQYLEYYGKRDDDQARQIRAWADQADVRRLERQLTTRMRVSMPPLDDSERTAREAVRAEETGDLTTARDRWQQTAEVPGAEQATWALLSAQRLQQLQEADTLAADLRRRLEEARRSRQKFEAASDTEREAALALRYELFGDTPLARKHWQELKKLATKDNGPRAWLLIAGKHDHDLAAVARPELDTAIFRKALISEKLADLKSPDAVLIAQDVIDLYAEDAALQELVQQARMLLVGPK
jgi:serine/threonine-protein kinase